MKKEEVEKRKERSEKELLIVSRVEEGLRVYSAADPKKFYIVSGTPDAPICTCPDFEYHAGDAGWRCKHILAALGQFYKIYSESSSSASPKDGEHQTIQQSQPAAVEQEAKQAEKPHPDASTNGTSHMLLKRSISPDGKIDSLSIEFACPVEKVPVKEIKMRAIKTLLLQSEIVQEFLNGTKNGNHKSNAPPKGNGHDSDGPVPAQLLNIGGMNGKWGRRLFINVQVNGQTSKFFGNRKQLGEFITTAGFAGLANHIEEGIQLNVPCRVITKPSADGRYLDIDQVFPAEEQRRAGR